MQNDGKVKIIEAAQRLISVQGVEKTSMRDIAEEAGLTTGAIYYYYKSKEELLYDVMDYSTTITSSIIEMSKGSSATPHGVLDEIARQVTKRLKTDSAQRLRYFLAYQAALGDETLQSSFAKAYEALADRTAKLFNYTFETPPQDVDKFLAVIMVAALDGINLQQYMKALPVEEHELARIYNEFFAYAIPLFQKNLKDIHRFDHLEDSEK